jgi:hypothetical protein
MHARTDFPADQRRLMLRTTIKDSDRPEPRLAGVDRHEDDGHTLKGSIEFLREIVAARSHLYISPGPLFYPAA